MERGNKILGLKGTRFKEMDVHRDIKFELIISMLKESYLVLRRYT